MVYTLQKRQITGRKKTLPKKSTSKRLEIEGLNEEIESDSDLEKE